MEFADIHIHALFNSDDGPKTEQGMRDLVSASYEDGVRVLCLTPHYHPGYFGENQQKSATAFQRLLEYESEAHPDLELFLGNELRYSPEAVSWLSSGACRTLNKTDYVLVDFSHKETEKNIIRSLERLMSGGYLPILAHAERYSALSLPAIQSLASKGVTIQLDVQSLFGKFGLTAKFRCKAILKAKLADVIASDAHDLTHRTPDLSKGYDYVARKYGQNYANALFYTNSLNILKGGNK